MARTLRSRGMIRKEKMLKAAAYLFMKYGYERTITSSVAKAADMASSSFFAAFESKEALLLELVKLFQENSLESVKMLPDVSGDQVLRYAVENSLSLYIAEQSEPLGELYVMAYSLPLPSGYIYQKSSEVYRNTFSVFLPKLKQKDFYEMNIAACGIKRAFLAQPCDLYFTVEQKMVRYLNCCLNMYGVPEEKQQQIIQTVQQMDLKTVAQNMVAELIRKAEEGWASIQQ